MKVIGITGQAGFVGTYLFNFFNLFKEELTTIPFKDEYFNDKELLNNWVRQCDVIVHLAAVNRNPDMQVLYDTNVELVRKIISSLEETNSKVHLLFSSSIQEDRDNLYGKSKRAGRELFIKWAEKNNCTFNGLLIPNVFGPFGNPYYNSVVSTFCHQLTHGEEPIIDVDGHLKLIYIGELAEEIYRIIKNNKSCFDLRIPHTYEIQVSNLLDLLKNFKTDYFEKGIIPSLNNTFEINLFNTFRSYIDLEKFFPVKLIKNTDQRGSFVETLKLNVGGQVSFSTTKAGITRGNHFHTRKVERFTVIHGKAKIQLRKVGTDKVLEFYLSGDEPAYVDMPIWYTHNISNIGQDELYTIFWINEFFNSEDPDTFFEIV